MFPYTAVFRLLEQYGVYCKELALSHGCALPGREPFLIGNLPKRLLPRFSARVAPQRGLHVTLPVPRVHAVRNVGMCGRSRHAPRRMPTLVTSACSHAHEHASSAHAV